MQSIYDNYLYNTFPLILSFLRFDYIISSHSLHMSGNLQQNIKDYI